jgi:alcohol dehydrogenase
VDTLAERLAMAKRLGADHTVDFRAGDPVEQIMQLTAERGVDVAIEALGTQATFEAALRVLRPGGALSSLGVYSMVTHRYKLDDVKAAYELFSHQRDGVLKIALSP